MITNIEAGKVKCVITKGLSRPGRNYIEAGTYIEVYSKKREIHTRERQDHTMYPDQLYALAFSFRKTKLWKKMFDSDLFAVSLPNDEIGYCCVMGRMSEHLALALYVGNRGLDSYRFLLEANDYGRFDPMKAHEIMTSQYCLQCSFESKSELSGQEVSSLDAYTAAHKIVLRGAKACPQFTSYRPAHYPWPVSDPEDERLLCAALEAAIAVSEKLKSEDMLQLGFQEGPPYDRSIPLLTPSEKGFSWSLHPLPPKQPEQFPEPVLRDDFMMMRLKKKKKSGNTWVCNVMMLPQPTEEAGSAPVFPYTLLLANNGTGMAMPTTAVTDYENHADELLQSLGEQMLEHGIPRQFVVADERSRCLLKNFAAALKIKLTLQPDNEEIEELEASFIDFFTNEQEDEVGPEDIFHVLMELDDCDFQVLPNELWSQLQALEEKGLLSEGATRQLEELKKRRKRK